MITQWADSLDWLERADRQVRSVSPDQAGRETDAEWLGWDGWVNPLPDTAKSPGAEG